LPKKLIENLHARRERWGAAALFSLLCSLSISSRVPDSSIILDARVMSMGSAAQNSLQAYELGYDALNILQEYGLIISDYASYIELSVGSRAGPQDGAACNLPK
jgi:hypothetical protein